MAINHNVKTLCRIVSVLLLLSIIAMPLSNLLFWCLVHTGNMASTDGWFAIGYKPSYPLPVVFWLQPISIGLRASLCGLEMIPIAFQIITLYFLWRLFTAYQ